MSSMMDAETLLAVDVGSVNTRANLFDVVDGRYRLVATGRAPSTAGRPLFDIGEGVRIAMDQVQAITGRKLFDESETLIVPATSDGRGIDVFVATASAGPSVRTVLVGLMPGVSLESARRLASATYLQVVEEVSLTDQRRDGEKIDVILEARPDLILITGGTDGGATESVLRMVGVVSAATGLVSDEARPHVVFAGNRELSASVAESFSQGNSPVLTPNIRPSLEHEDLTQARLRLAEIIADTRASHIHGFEELKQWAGGYLMLSADSFGRIIRYLSQIYDPDKGVLGIDLGASHTVVAAAFAGDLRMSVRSDLGLGSASPGVLKHSSAEQIARWLPFEMNLGRLRDYIFNKAAHPRTVPADVEDLHVEYALAREMIRASLNRARLGWPEGKGGRESWLMPALEPIIASGGALARTPRAGYAALILLDALQPTGISTLVLDPYSLTPSLGAAAGPLPMAAVQVLASGGYVSLGTVVSPVGRSRVGRPVLKLRLEREEGGERSEGEVRAGQLVVLPLGQGEHGKLTLRPEHGFDVGFGGPGRAGALRVAGGAVGLIIDARGRPLALARDAGRRRDLNQKWLWDIGALQ
jgi:hypothetical protein